MSGLLLIGLAPPGCALPPDCPRHRRLPNAVGIGLALEIADLKGLESEDGTAELAQVQHEILCRYILISDVIPIALGAAFSSSSAIIKHLEADARELAALHDRLAGRVEFSVALSRINAPQVEPAQAAIGGAAHLRSRMKKRNQTRRHRDHAHTEIVTLGQKLSQFCETSQLRQSRRQDRLATYDVLLERWQISDFLDMLSEIARGLAMEGFALAATGPCPAFSFLKAQEDA